ncbi:hypothetical protein BDQ17DRAFT_547619 [Cyathus striatus]|nr:hypothetical protein BDQ17DRAFT_547619 [Cyathus striatus]
MCSLWADTLNVWPDVDVDSRRGMVNVVCFMDVPPGAAACGGCRYTSTNTGYIKSTYCFRPVVSFILHFLVIESLSYSYHLYSCRSSETIWNKDEAGHREEVWRYLPRKKSRFLRCFERLVDRWMTSYTPEGVIRVPINSKSLFVLYVRNNVVFHLDLIV